jgi:hypothetical protein
MKPEAVQAHTQAELERFRQLEGMALCAEAARFFRKNPDVQRLDVIDGRIEVWMVVDHSGTRWAYFTEAGSVAFQMLTQAESLMAGVAPPFVERLERWRSSTRPDRDDKARRLAARVARRLLPVAWKKTLAVLEKSVESVPQALRALGEETAAQAREFATEHAAAHNPSTDELVRLTLWLRALTLLGTGPTLEAMQEAATGNPLLREAMRAYDAWKARLDESVQRHGDGPETQAIAKEQNAVTGRLLYAFHWPRILEEWKTVRRPASLARLPTTLVTGGGAIAPLFGRSLPKDTRVVPKSHADGRLRNVVISRRTAQLDLLMPSRAALRNPTNEQVLDALARVLANREWRVFVAALVAASEDLGAGRVPQPGGFFYTPGRFGALLGLRDRESTRKLDDSLEALMGVSVTATMKRGGRDFKLRVESLVVDGRATLTPTDQAKKRGRGRPSARLYRIQDNILELLGEGGSWFPITRDMLRPPEGVDARTWDDCFKLETVMAAYARQEPGKAKGADALPWARKASTLLDATGIAGQWCRPHEKARRLCELLDVVNATGRVVAEFDAETVRYDMPQLRPLLREIDQAKRPKTLEGGR